jgi:hypothetical protein
VIVQKAVIIEVLLIAQIIYNILLSSLVLYGKIIQCKIRVLTKEDVHKILTT